MNKNLMKKVCKLQAEYTQKLKELFNDNLDCCYSYSWTMGYDSGKKGSPVYAYYLDGDVKDRIKYFKMVQPEKVECYKTEDRDLVKEIVTQQYLEQFED